MDTSNTTATSTRAPVSPLEEFYARAGQPLPPLAVVEGREVPEPAKTLLVHQNDMTPTLEKFHQARIHLQVLGRRRKGDEYFREVVLRLDGSNRPVEFGAIKVNLALFAPAARELILQEKIPLGTILASCQVAHASRPSAYLRVASDRFINEILGLTGACVLYGRCNTIYNPQSQPLAEIVEILP